eukprot:5432628-Ditylum_brightwellii.AAC.1
MLSTDEVEALQRNWLNMERGHNETIDAWSTRVQTAAQELQSTTITITQADIGRRWRTEWQTVYQMDVKRTSLLSYLKIEQCGTSSKKARIMTRINSNNKSGNNNNLLQRLRQGKIKEAVEIRVAEVIHREDVVVINNKDISNNNKMTKDNNNRGRFQFI